MHEELRVCISDASKLKVMSSVRPRDRRRLSTKMGVEAGRHMVPDQLLLSHTPLHEKGSFETCPHEERRCADRASPLSRLTLQSHQRRVVRRISDYYTWEMRNIRARHLFNFWLWPYATNLRRALRVRVYYF
jgi:hypothetical protein